MVQGLITKVTRFVTATEEFGKESEAIERVAQLRESGSFGAFYSVITPGEK